MLLFSIFIKPFISPVYWERCNTNYTFMNFNFPFNSGWAVVPVKEFQSAVPLISRKFSAKIPSKDLNWPCLSSSLSSKEHPGSVQLN